MGEGPEKAEGAERERPETREAAELSGPELKEFADGLTEQAGREVADFVSQGASTVKTVEAKYDGKVTAEESEELGEIDQAALAAESGFKQEVASLTGQEKNTETKVERGEPASTADIMAEADKEYDRLYVEAGAEYDKLTSDFQQKSEALQAGFQERIAGLERSDLSDADKKVETLRLGQELIQRQTQLALETLQRRYDLQRAHDQRIVAVGTETKRKIDVLFGLKQRRSDDLVKKWDDMSEKDRADAIIELSGVDVNDPEFKSKKAQYDALRAERDALSAKRDALAAGIEHGSSAVNMKLEELFEPEFLADYAKQRAEAKARGIDLPENPLDVPREMVASMEADRDAETDPEERAALDSYIKIIKESMGMKG